MALGRGLSELLGEVESAYESNSDLNKDLIKEISLSQITPNPYQPRKIFDEEKLKELANSIDTHGLMQPVVVIKENETNNYILVAGERRFRAVKSLKLDTIQAIVANIEVSKLREYALLENIQRDDLNILEVAYSYAGLINEYNMTHEELSNIVHKSRSSITNILRLLTLSKYAQQCVSQDKISLGHAKVIMGLEEDDQKTIIDSIMGQKLSVRETENLVRNLKNKEKKEQKTPKSSQKIDFKPIESLVESFKSDNLNIKISKNSIKIDIQSQNDIETILKYFIKK
jgi:ParB family chromosome partitioning protein